MENDTKPTNLDSDSAANAAGDSSLSLARVIRVVAPIVIVLVGCALFATSQLTSQANKRLQADLLEALLGKAETIDAGEFSDNDGDMVADAPDDAKAVTPEKLLFSYVASDDSASEADLWKPLVATLAEKTGLPVEFVAYTKAAEQAEALRDGELHITAYSTGAVPLAVSRAGFVPVSTLGDAEGNFGVTMQLLVPVKSDVKSIEDLAKPGDKLPKIEFVSTSSNSGFKAALVLLMDDYDMYPERDYTYSFSWDYDQSMKDIAAGKAAVAPVVSDLLDQAFADGLIEQESVRAIYESERFPPAAFGYAHNLSPALREAIREVLLNFEWEGTPIAERFGKSGSTQFVPVDYKNDWANIRRIDDAIAKARNTGS